MACNCTTEKQLKALYEKYGGFGKIERGDTLTGKIKYYAYKFGLIAVLLNVIPMITVYVLYLSTFKDGKLSFKDFFNLKENNITTYYERKQQEFKNKNQGW